MLFRSYADKAILPNLDGIRAMACLLVVVSHMPLPGKPATLGALGVGVFFVLSGFLIGGILLDYRLATNYFKTFYIRRACRIFPLYYFTLACFCGIVGVGLVDSESIRSNPGWHWLFVDQGLSGEA